jgi:hypothetical protein
MSSNTMTMTAMEQMTRWIQQHHRQRRQQHRAHSHPQRHRDRLHDLLAARVRAQRQPQRQRDRLHDLPAARVRKRSAIATKCAYLQDRSGA